MVVLHAAVLNVIDPESVAAAFPIVPTTFKAFVVHPVHVYAAFVPPVHQSDPDDVTPALDNEVVSEPDANAVHDDAIMTLDDEYSGLVASKLYLVGMPEMRSPA